MEPVIGMTLRVRGKNGKGRDLVHRVGDKWQIRDLKNTVEFDSRVGSWALIYPPEDPAELRWCLLGCDNTLILLDMGA